MLATSAGRLPEGDHWSYEVKWDGYRTLTVKDGTRVTLLSRNLKDATAQLGSEPERAALFCRARVPLCRSMNTQGLWQKLGLPSVGHEVSVRRS
jgi:hypothetical protein